MRSPPPRQQRQPHGQSNHHRGAGYTPSPSPTANVAPQQLTTAAKRFELEGVGHLWKGTALREEELRVLERSLAHGAVELGLAMARRGGG